MQAVQLSAAILCGFCYAQLAVAQSASSALYGAVIAGDSTRAPVVGAEILLPALRRRTHTDSAGNFVLGSIPAGRHALLVRRLGFAAHRDTLELSGLDSVPILVFLDLL